MQYFNYNKSFEQNKKTYRMLVKNHHPDVGGDKKTFLEVQNQWELYSNTYTKANTFEKKQAFNQFAKDVDFSKINDPIKFYEDNKQTINIIINKVIRKNQSPITDDEIMAGFKIAKDIFNLFK